MTHSYFHEKSVFLAEIQKANEKMKSLLGRIKVALSEQGYPLRKDTYHFLTRVLEPTNRAERTLFMLLFQSAYRSELFSAGSSYLTIRFANEFIEQLLKHSELTSRNEVDLMNEFDELALNLNQQITSLSQPVTEEWLQKEIERICEDPTLGAAVWEAISVSGLEGKIHVEDGSLANYLVEQKSGYYFKQLKAFKFMLPKNGCWEAQNVKVMLVDGVLERVSELDKILNGAMQTKIPVLLAAHGFSEEVIATIKVNCDYEKFNLMPVKLSLDLDSLNVLNDVAVVCGTDVISTLKGQMIVYTEFDSLPIVEKIRLTSQGLSIENAKTRRAVSNQLLMLLEKRQTQSNISDLSDLIDGRIQGLISAAVTIRLPNMVPAQRENTKVKIDVALRSAKTLLNLGRVNLRDIKDSPAPHGSLQGAFWKALKKVQEEIDVMPTLSAYVGICLIGKVVLTMMSSSGLVTLDPT